MDEKPFPNPCDRFDRCDSNSMNKTNALLDSEFVVSSRISSLILQGMWIGMLCGVGAQTLVLMYMTWRTDWDDQVDTRTNMKSLSLLL